MYHYIVMTYMAYYCTFRAGRVPWYSIPDAWYKSDTAVCFPWYAHPPTPYRYCYMLHVNNARVRQTGEDT